MSEEIPKISIFASAIKTHLWMNFYNSIGKNDIPYEIVFVGPTEPNFKLPDNFRFIKSNVKPAQCFEIAARNTKADLILNMADDVVFKTERPLDKLYNTYKLYNNDKMILSCRYSNAGEAYSESRHVYYSVIIPVGGLISKKIYREVGGIDKNFIVTYGDTDIAFRIYNIGGCVKLSDVWIDEPRGAGGSHTNYGDYHYFNSIWSESRDSQGIVHLNRSKVFEPFSDDRILEETQGPKNKWV